MQQLAALQTCYRFDKGTLSRYLGMDENGMRMGLFLKNAKLLHIKDEIVEAELAKAERLPAENPNAYPFDGWAEDASINLPAFFRRRRPLDALFH